MTRFALGLCVGLVAGAIGFAACGGHAQTPDAIAEMVDQAAQHFGLYEWDRQRAHRVIRCESGYRNVANFGGSGATGPAQFMPRTFYATAPLAGFAGASIWDARANVFTAVYLMSQGQWGHWRACW